MEFTIAKILRTLFVIKEEDGTSCDDSEDRNEYAVDDTLISMGVIIGCMIICALIFSRLM